MNITYGQSNNRFLSANDTSGLWFFGEKKITKISSGSNHSVLLTNGGFFSFGYMKERGVIQSTPIKVNGLDDEKVVWISCGGTHSLALTQSGKVFGWGLNSSGELGLGHNHNETDAVKVSSSIDNIDFKKISCGQNHSL